MPEAFNNETKAKAAVKALSQQQHGIETWCGFMTPAPTITEQPFPHVRHWCCTMGEKHGPSDDCGDPNKLTGMSAGVFEFAVNEAAWIDTFHEAWKKVTELN